MKYIYRLILMTITLFLFSTISGCAPEVGSEAWCSNMKEKPKGDWTANELADYTKHCIF